MCRLNAGAYLNVVRIYIYNFMIFGGTYLEYVRAKQPLRNIELYKHYTWGPKMVANKLRVSQ